MKKKNKKGQSKSTSHQKDKPKHQWKAVVTFVPFESKEQRDQAYRTWVRLFIKGKEREIAIKKGLSKGKQNPSEGLKKGTGD